MLSKTQIKHITALRAKKYRTEHAQFFVEGKKSVADLINSGYEVLALYYTSDNSAFAKNLFFNNSHIVTDIDYQKISMHTQPEGIMAIVKIPEVAEFRFEHKNYIALDAIRDPGNLGTIIRLADWFGINSVLCSEDCVELYNPKVIQASMGSIFNIKVHYIDLADQFNKTDLPKYAATMDGKSIYETEAIRAGILVIGNEANGISPAVLQACNYPIGIPARGKAESLNAAMACGILCSHLFR